MGPQIGDEALEEALAEEERLESEEDEPDEAAGGAAPEAPEDEAHPPADEFGDPETIDPEAIDPDARRALTSIRDIQGVPLWYERAPATPGPRSFFVAPDFVPLLERTVRALQNRTPRPFGKLTRIVTAGIFVAKGGAHEAGHACDWDRLVFENLEIAPIERDHLSSSVATRQRYWGFAAICGSVAAPTLHGEYDQGPHDDHVHLADNLAFGFRRDSKASVSLAQAVLNEIFGQTPKLTVDQVYGEKTDAALTAALARVRLDGTVEEPAVWRRFLRRSARIGFVQSLRR